MSLPEIVLWQALRQRPQRLKFRRQFPIDQITVDFACLERRLAIEIDGEQHGFADQSRRDLARDALLHRFGFSVLRIPARDVLNDADAALRWILARCSAVGPLHHSPSANGPPPRDGEE